MNLNMKNKNIFSLLATMVLVVFLAACHRKSVVTVSALNDTTTIIKVKGPDRYLIVPVEESAAALQVLIQKGTKRAPLALVRLALTKADYYVPVRLPDGVNTVVVLHAPKGAFFLKNIRIDNRFEQTSNDQLRSVYHYSPAFGWMGRPAAAVRGDDGIYHVFYECNPHGCKAENYHWGQVTSKDLVNWTEQETAFGGDSIGEALGGSIVLDKRNVFGVGANAWIAMYTATRAEGAARRQEQCLEYSTDEGKTFTRFQTNPVLRTYDDNPDFRHPNVVRYKRASIWNVVLACKEKMRIYSSAELGTWNLESYLGEGWGIRPASYESGQLFEVKAPGNKTKWLLICSKNSYVAKKGSFSECFIGDFDGKNFIPDDTKGCVLDGGFDYTGAMAFENEDSRCLVAGWLNNVAYSDRLPSFPFRGEAALPRELSLVEEQGKLSVVFSPAKELEGLRQEEKTLGTFDVNGPKDLKQILEKNKGAFELTMQVADLNVKRFAVIIYNEKGEQVEISLKNDALGNHLQLNRLKSGILPNDMAESDLLISKTASHQLRIFVDRTSVEVFLDNGRAVMSDLVFPSQPYSAVKFSSEGGKTVVSNLKVYRLGTKK